ncbi:hypothetical protein M0812_03442 [Anaeramoeba flamelloides]|uniref:Uncharacterized protein n=1 Tax=Anaeramoeba flamelloides TaxID=1746091 RepID=A0AAV8AHL8_9EUKA|nr:hypothetical protein M0812_03442 [Anaeramoeba flamelloides]
MNKPLILLSEIAIKALLSLNNSKLKPTECTEKIFYIKKVDENPNIQACNGCENTTYQYGNISGKELKQFFSSKPRPSWGKRLHYIFLYENSFIDGWNDSTLSRLEKQLKCPKRISIDKDMFCKLAGIILANKDFKTKDRFIKSSQRGIEEYLKRKGYRKKNKYNRNKMVFIRPLGRGNNI